MSIRNLFKQISVDIWNQIHFTNTYKLNFGEVTITDNMVYQIWKYAKDTGITNIIIHHAKDEKSNGSDLLYFLEIEPGIYIQFAIQAKKLKIDCKESRYTAMSHLVNSTKKPQIDILLEYGKCEKAIPMYMLYNYSEHPKFAKREYYGCSLISANFVKAKFSLPITKCKHPTFDDLHIKKIKKDMVAIPFYWLSSSNIKCLLDKYRIKYSTLDENEKCKIISKFTHMTKANFLNSNNHEIGFYPNYIIVQGIDKQ